jgi:hypothetical protein
VPVRENALSTAAENQGTHCLNPAVIQSKFVATRRVKQVWSMLHVRGAGWNFKPEPGIEFLVTENSMFLETEFMEICTWNIVI